MWPSSSHLRYAWLAYFSKPAHDRLVYKLVRRRGATRILELGLGTAQRAQRLIGMISETAAVEQIGYTAVDLFELRGAADGPGLSLKLAHRLLATSGARIRLVPGDPYSALSRSANVLGMHDLMIVSADQDPESLARAWFYVPRVLSAEAPVLIEQRTERSDGFEFCELPRSTIERLAAQAAPRRAA